MRSIARCLQSGRAVISRRWGHAAAGPAADPGPRARLPWSRRVLVLAGTAADTVVADLAQAGYAVSAVENLPAALAVLEQGQVALILLSGPQAVAQCRAVRRVTAAPILALLPELTEAAVLEAFSAGVDDCQSAAISPPETVLRVRAILRRGGTVQVATSGAAPDDFDARMRKVA